MLNASRRGFLRTTLGTAWTSATLLEQSVLRAASARGMAAAAPAADLFTIEKLGDGAWAALSKPATFVNCNGAIFELSDGLLVVDSHSKPSAAAALVAQIRRSVSPKPVRYLVNSHFHWDHAQGNSVYRQMPGVKIIASEPTRRLLADGADGRMKAAVENAAQALEAARQKRASATAAEERARLDRTIADTEAYLKELRAFRLELPDITTRGDLTLHDKQQELQIVFRGRGHTEGDISVWSPSRRTVATGDLAHGALPFMGDGFPGDWPNTLGSLAQLDFDRWAGGHGGVNAGRLRMDQMRNYIQEIAWLVGEGVRRGRPLEAMQKEITPAALSSMKGGYLEALAGGGPVERVAAGIAANVAQVHAKLARG